MTPIGEKAAKPNKMQAHNQALQTKNKSFEKFIRNDKVIIYPNPANNQLNIILNTLYSYEVNIIDNLGRIRHKAFSREPHCVLDVSDFEFGSYYLRIISNNKILNKKLIIN